MILTVCTNADLLSIMIYVRIILNMLQIIAPVGVVIFASIDVIKAVISSKQEEIYAKLHMIPKRLIAAVIVFLVPAIIDLVMGVADKNFEYASCFTNATEENVQKAYVYNAQDAVALAENSLKMYDYENALLITNKVKDESIKASLTDRLNAVLDTIKANNDKDALAESAAKKGTKKIISDNSGSNSNSSSTGDVNFADSNSITTTALSHIGTTYVWGGTTWSGGVDCSGFVYRVLNDVGYTVPRLTADGYRTIGCGVSSIEAAKPGDLLIYGTRHIAIYLGEDSNGNKWRVHASGDQSCNGKTATGCQVKKDTRAVTGLYDGESLTIRRVTGDC